MGKAVGQWILKGLLSGVLTWALVWILAVAFVWAARPIIGWITAGFRGQEEGVHGATQSNVEGHKGVWLGWFLGLLSGLLVLFLQPFVVRYGASVAEAWMPEKRRAALSLDFLHNNADGTMTVSVSNTGKIQSVLERANFCPPGRTYIMRGVGSELEIQRSWVVTPGNESPMLSSYIAWTLAGPDADTWGVTCFQDGVFEVLQIQQGKRSVEPTHSEEVRVTLPAAYRLRSLAEEESVSYNHECLIQLQADNYRVSRMLPCMPVAQQPEPEATKTKPKGRPHAR